MKTTQNPNIFPVKMNYLFIYLFKSTSIKFMYFRGNIFHIPIYLS